MTIAFARSQTLNQILPTKTQEVLYSSAPTHTHTRAFPPFSASTLPLYILPHLHRIAHSCIYIHTSFQWPRSRKRARGKDSRAMRVHVLYLPTQCTRKKESMWPPRIVRPAYMLCGPVYIRSFSLFSARCAFFYSFRYIVLCYTIILSLSPRLFLYFSRRGEFSLCVPRRVHFDGHEWMVYLYARNIYVMKDSWAALFSKSRALVISPHSVYCVSTFYRLAIACVRVCVWYNGEPRAYVRYRAMGKCWLVRVW